MNRRKFMLGGAALAAAAVVPSPAPVIDVSTYRWWRNTPMPLDDAAYQRLVWEACKYGSATGLVRVTRDGQVSIEVLTEA